MKYVHSPVAAVAEPGGNGKLSSSPACGHIYCKAAHPEPGTPASAPATTQSPTAESAESQGAHAKPSSHQAVLSTAAAISSAYSKRTSKFFHKLKWKHKLYISVKNPSD
ncbi:unnamed protein product [[Candida] boidinii]|uniref:Unnamed protein product n=1 Tax=Candida boidinii TaxID=5477 RepID=A0ACB5TMY9_CANBO|nr:unnamed protein product [[Candida] boidinii]